MASPKQCKYCKEQIEFRKIRGKFLPADPVSGLKHVCEQEHRCKGCGNVFMGEAWKKLCPSCWQVDNLDKHRMNRGRS